MLAWYVMKRISTRNERLFSLSNQIHAYTRITDLYDISFVYIEIQKKRKTPRDIRKPLDNKQGLNQFTHAILNLTRYLIKCI